MSLPFPLKEPRARLPGCLPFPCGEGSPAPLQTRWIYHFDGVDDLVTIPAYNLVAGDFVEFEFMAPSSPVNDIQLLLSDSSKAWSTLARVDVDGAIVFWQSSAKLDGVEIETGVTMLPMDGKAHKVRLEMTGSYRLDLVGAQSNGAGSFLRFCNMAIFNLNVNGVLYALDTIGGSNETQHNFNDERWSEINV